MKETDNKNTCNQQRLDAIETAIVNGVIPHSARLPNLYPILTGKRPHEWYAIISASDVAEDFKKENPKLWDALYTISDEEIQNIVAHIEGRSEGEDVTEFNLELERVNVRHHSFEVCSLSRLYGITA